MAGIDLTFDDDIYSITTPSPNVLTGTAGNDTIDGTAGNDNISGLGGDDRIDSGTGKDTIDGGAGNDSLSIYNFSDPANTTISYTTATNGLITGGSNNGTTFKNIEGLVIGTGSGADNIDISASTNTTSDSFSDYNYVFSGAGNDTIKGGAGDDRIDSGTGKDSIDGGAGNDALAILNFSDPANTTISYTTASNGVVTGGSNNGTTFKNIESLVIGTGDGADNIDISATKASSDSFVSRNYVYSGAGNDTIEGGAGDDRIDSGTGKETIDGGAGSDLLLISNALDTANTTISYTTATNGVVTGGSNNGTTFKNIERLDISTGDGADNIDLSATTNTPDSFFPSIDLPLIQVGSSVSSGAGNDTIKGGAGNDRLNSGTGKDSIDGGAGNDSLSISNFSDLANTTISYTTATNGVITGGSNNGTTFKNIERLDISTGAGADNIDISASTATSDAISPPMNIPFQVGNGTIDGRSSVFSGAGNDIIKGGAGDDSIDAGDGDDTLKGSAGNDLLSGGAGKDLFILGDANNSSYGGSGQFTKIVDFDVTGDRVQLQGLASNYRLAVVSGNTDLYLGTANNSTDKKIATFQNVTGLNLSSNRFQYVAAINPTVTLAVSPATVNEDGLTNLLYTFTRTGATTNALTINYGFGGTATLGTDYTQTGVATFTGNTGTVTFAAGANIATVTINPTSDSTIELNETVALTLIGGNGYTVGTTTAITGTIINDDTQSAISISDTTIVEGINGNPSQSLITVSLDKASTQAVSVNYATGNITAIAGTDYTATTGTLTFAAGQTSLTIAVPIVNNDLNEANETFQVTLSAPTNATIADNKAIVTIADTLSTNVTSTLAALVENITLTGTSAVNGTGNAGNNVLIGNAANNTLTGLNGNDIYSYDADLVQGIDTISETSTGGIDTLNFSQTAAAVNINLGLTTSQTVNGNLKLVIPAVAIENVVGGGGNDRITGNSFNNTLTGGNGEDLLVGRGGNDVILGGAGNDIIIGGDGNDVFGYTY